jgi:hypothetical protein
MNDMWKDILLVLLGGGLIIELFRFLLKKGGDNQVLTEHGNCIVDLQNDARLMKERLHALEQSTSIRLTAIEVELKNLSADIQEMSKDIKLILKRNIYGEE